MTAQRQAKIPCHRSRFPAAGSYTPHNEYKIGVGAAATQTGESSCCAVGVDRKLASGYLPRRWDMLRLGMWRFWLPAFSMWLTSRFRRCSASRVSFNFKFSVGGRFSGSGVGDGGVMGVISRDAHRRCAGLNWPPGAALPVLYTRIRLGGADSDRSRPPAAVQKVGRTRIPRRICRGVGFESARLFLQSGARVIGAASDREVLEGRPGDLLVGGLTRRCRVRWLLAGKRALLGRNQGLIHRCGIGRGQQASHDIGFLHR